MAQTFKNLNIIYSNGSPKFSPAAGVTDLNQLDGVRLRLSGFPVYADGSEPHFAKIDFYGNKVVNDEDTKDLDTPRGSWNSKTGGNEYLTAFSIGSGNDQTGGYTYIQDEEDPTADDKFWFGVTIEAGLASSPDSWSVDPELVNKKKG